MQLRGFCNTCQTEVHGWGHWEQPTEPDEPGGWVFNQAVMPDRSFGLDLDWRSIRHQHHDIDQIGEN